MWNAVSFGNVLLPERALSVSDTEIKATFSVRPPVLPDPKTLFTP